MKIMSFNLLCAGNNEHWWPNRIDLVTNTIKEVAPDLLGVQEAHQGWMDVLTNALEDYSYVGVGRDDGKTGGEYSAIFYRTEDFEALDSGNFWLSKTPDVPSKGWDAACIRICTWAKLRNLKSGDTFVYMNTHTDHKGRKAKSEGAKLISAMAKEIAGDLPVYLSGDFNSRPDDIAIKAIKDKGFFDVREIAVDADKGPTWHSYGAVPAEILDYIFTNKPETEIKKFSVIKNHPGEKPPSDHYPIVAII